MGSSLRNEHGFTLVELLVTMSLLSVVMTLIVGSAIFLQHTMNETDQRFDDLAQARLGMDAATKWLRSAVTVEPYTQPFLEARADQVEFLANINVEGSAPKQVLLRVNNGALEQQVYDGVIDASGDWQQSGPPRTRILARGVTNDVALFSFFDADGTDLTNGTTPLPANALADIRRVGIALTIQQSPAIDVPPSQLSNRVHLPNQFYFDTQGQT